MVWVERAFAVKVCSISRYFYTGVMLYFGKPVRRVKIQDTSKNIPR